VCTLELSHSCEQGNERIISLEGKDFYLQGILKANEVETFERTRIEPEPLPTIRGFHKNQGTSYRLKTPQDRRQRPDQ
jgi:hypothetical protein